jgi:hypothetical protein
MLSPPPANSHMNPTDQSASAPDEADLDVDLLEYLQSLTPAERLKRQLDALELVRALRRAGAEHHGVDPRSTPTSR